VEPRIARRAAASALIAGVAFDVLFDRSPLGINVPIATAGVLALVTWFSANRRPADRLDLWLPAVALLAALGPAFRTDPSVVVLDLWLVAGSVAAWSFAVSGIAVTRRTASAVAGLGATAVGASIVGLGWLLAHAGADGFLSEATKNLGRMAPVVRGAIIAVPIVFCFTVLLTSADAVFGRALDEALRLPFDVEDVVGRGVFSILAAAFVAGPIALAAGAGASLPGFAPVGQPRGWEEVRPIAGAAGPEGATESAAPATGEGRTKRRSGATEALVVLGAVDLLFAMFAVVQVVFLFGGKDTLAAIGMNYSDYARQGYFQLAGVVALAGLLLLGAHEVVGRTRAFLYAGTGLLVLTGVILVSAAVRLSLYQGAYGWTELRFYVAASIAWLALCVLLALALLIRDRMRWLPHGLAMSAVAVTLAVSVLGPQAYVMHANLARVLDPSLVAPGGYAGLDIYYGLTLGDDAIPDLVAAMAVLDERVSADLRIILTQRAAELEQESQGMGPLSWNLAREQAREALAQLPGP
jgi:Domain of unknown function (DUF4173)